MVIEDGQITENLNSEAVQNQENLSSQESQPAETVDYSTLSLSELISAMEKFCTKELVETNRKAIEDIRTQFYKRQKKRNRRGTQTLHRGKWFAGRVCFRFKRK